jgi:arginine N-succinyltransferase
MFLIRPITRQDLDILEAFASDAYGITSIPKSRSLLALKIEQSLLSFAKQVDYPRNENYLFVLEERESHRVGGVCGIVSKLGVEEPLYFYHIERIHLPASPLPLTPEIQLLHPLLLQNGPTQIGALYLSPEFRKAGAGRLLSLCRFLFMASFPNRFENLVSADMRGYIDENKHSPFWDGLGRNFLNVEFDELMRLLEESKDFVRYILPYYPLYVNLLSYSTQDAIGKVHVDTRPALNMLLQEGFFMTENIDLFDGGPQIRAKRHEIRTIRDSALAKVVSLTDTPIESKQFLVCNRQLDFRACYAHLAFDSKGHTTLSKEVAEALNIKRDDLIQYVLSSPESQY